MTAEPGPPMAVPNDMRDYAVLLLLKGPRWTDEQTPERVGLQSGHLAHLRELHESRKLLFAGPLTDNGTIRGIALFRSTDEAAALMAHDPAVRAGLFSLEIHPAYLPSLEAVRVTYP